MVIFIYKLRCTYLISSEPTQFQPPWFSIFGRVFCENYIRAITTQDEITKDVEFSCASLVYVKNFPNPNWFVGMPT